MSIKVLSQLNLTYCTVARLNAYSRALLNYVGGQEDKYIVYVCERVKNVLCTASFSRG